MTTAYTSLLGLALPFTGELSGTWGDTVNVSITALLDSAIAGTTTLSSDADVTLTTTTGAANTSREAILLCSGARTVLRTITAPAQSKIYTIINATTGGFSVKLVGAGPTTGVTIVAGESAVVAWNGSDFIKISNTGGAISFTNVTVTGTTTLSGLTASTALALDASKNVVSVTNTGTGSNVLATSPTLVTPALGTPSSGVATNLTGLPLSTGVTGTLITTNGGTGLTSYTAGDLPYYAAGTVLSKLTIGTAGQILTSSGAAPQWSTLSGVAVTTFSAGTTGFTPSSATSGAVTLAGTLATTNGGTGLTSFTANGVVYASSTSALATGSALTWNTTNFSIVPNAAGSYTNTINLSGSQSNGTKGHIGQFADGLYLTSNYYYDSGQAVDTATYGVAGISLVSGTTTNSYIAFGITAAGGSGLSEQMRLTSTGLGIGTSSPDTRLDVRSANKIVDGIGNVFFATTDSIAADKGATLSLGGVYSGVSAYPFGAISAKKTNATSGDASGYLAFYTTNPSNTIGERARINSAGNLGLGVTPSAWQTTSYKVLQVNRASIMAEDVTAVRLNQNYYIDSAYASRYIADGYATFYAQINGSHNWQISGTSAGTAGNIVSFTQAMTLDASGRLGIGNTSPTTNLAVGSGAGSGGYGGGVYLNRGPSAYNFYEASDGTNSIIFGFDNTLSNAKIGTINSYPIGFYTGNTERARFDTSGNLLVGTTSTGSSGSARIVSAQATGGGLQLAHINSGGGALFVGLATGGVATYTYTGAVGSESYTERARIDSSGNLLVGTTTNTYNTKANIYASGQDVLSLINAAAGGYNLRSDTQSNGGTYFHVLFLDNGTSHGSITSNGTLTTYNTTSDYRLKTVIGPVADAGSRIDALQPVEYTWNSNGSRTRGFLAHQFQEVYASSVSGTKDAVNAEGKPVYQAMQASSSEVIADLVAEIQSLRTRLAALEAK